MFWTPFFFALFSACTGYIVLEELMKIPNTTTLYPQGSTSVVRSAARVCLQTRGCGFVDEKFATDDPKRPNCVLYTNDSSLANPNMAVQADLEKAKLFSVYEDTDLYDCCADSYPIVDVRYENGTTVITEATEGGGPPTTSIMHGLPRTQSTAHFGETVTTFVFQRTAALLSAITAPFQATTEQGSEAEQETTSEMLPSTADDDDHIEPTTETTPEFEATTTTTKETETAPLTTETAAAPESTKADEPTTEEPTTTKTTTTTMTTMSTTTMASATNVTTTEQHGFTLWSDWSPCGRLAGTCDFTTRVRSCIGQPADCVGNTTDTMVCGNSASSYPFPCAPCLTGCKPLLRKMPNGTQYYYCSPKGWDNRTQRVFYDTPVLFQDSCL